ncbi:hypothetical protein CM19_07720 [Candidatus Acidianus copahuensis]|uniref:Carboxypeptidase regulatory-like domain-containing protein n=2 Tax=Acidianus TaxID=12914 RepID=A0A031LMZ2_9CREN|nr:hypothetical protein [Candidatus Acidianus copahuensis]EZQ04861.1 hypothetical protein CM19_07720 [Candidatus Acidianus copahuensis]NON63177.1 hypothetical protein [Acidianus sp. RZ1]
MNKRLLLVLGIVILVITIAGVFLASNYKTRVYVSAVPGVSVNGKYPLTVKVIMNYGPFGGQSPLSDAVVQIYAGGHFLEENFTNSSGEITFYLPKGSYEVIVTQLHYSVNVNLNTGKVIEVNYAYLKS